MQRRLNAGASRTPKQKTKIAGFIPPHKVIGESKKAGLRPTNNCASRCKNIDSKERQHPANKGLHIMRGPNRRAAVSTSDKRNCKRCQPPADTYLRIVRGTAAQLSHHSISSRNARSAAGTWAKLQTHTHTHKHTHTQTHNTNNSNTSKSSGSSSSSRSSSYNHSDSATTITTRTTTTTTTPTTPTTQTTARICRVAFAPTANKQAVNLTVGRWQQPKVGKLPSPTPGHLVCTRELHSQRFAKAQ